MKHEVRFITDPLGNTIQLPCECGTNAEETDHDKYDDAATVILKPAMMIQVKEGKQEIMYYFRSVGWHKTMLIIVNYKLGKWEHTKCIFDPSNEMLSEIMKKGTQLI